MPREHPKTLLALALLLATAFSTTMAFHFADTRTTRPRSFLTYTFSPFPDGFERNTRRVKPGSVCYLVVHPGYATYAEAGPDVIANGDAYGDYEAYLQNLEALTARLCSEPSIAIYGTPEQPDQQARQRVETAQVRLDSLHLIASGRVNHGRTRTDTDGESKGDAGAGKPH